MTQMGRTEWSLAGGGPALTPAERGLLDMAAKARDGAYAPYSRYLVGAAVSCEDGSTYDGCNIENASYGLSICAERVAVFKAVSSGRLSLLAIAVVAGGDDPASPCGACRQVIAEFGPEATVLMANVDGTVVRSTVPEILPGCFVLKPRDVAK